MREERYVVDGDRGRHPQRERRRIGAREEHIRRIRSHRAAQVGLVPPRPAPRSRDDLADVTRYELTMDRIDRYYAASRNMAVAASKLTPLALALSIALGLFAVLLRPRELDRLAGAG